MRLLVSGALGMSLSACFSPAPRDFDTDDTIIEGGDGDGDGDGDIDPTPLGAFSNIRILSELNQPEGSDDPSLTADMLDIYWSGYSAATLEDIYHAHRDTVDGAWSTPVRETTNAGYEYSPEIAPNGLSMIFAAADDDRGDFYTVVRATRTSAWGGPVLMDNISSASRDVRGVQFDNRLRILFSSERIGAGALEYNIWEASRATAIGPFGDVRPVPSLNTDEPEFSATITNDGLLVYFHRRVGGQYDIFRATRDSMDAPFTDIEPVAELNTPNFDESDPWLSPDQRTIFYTSTQPAPGQPDDGNNKLYQATR